MSRDPLLVLGADAGLARACESLGVRAIRCVGPWEKDYVLRAAPVTGDDVFVEDPACADIVLAALHRAGFADVTVRGVCVSSDAYIGAAAFLRAALGAGGTTGRGGSWLPHKDKRIQKQAVAAAGVEVTPYRVLEDIWEPDVADGWEHFPAVLKPISQQGSSGTALVHDDTELAGALALARADGARRTYLLERFVDGTELHVDGVVSGGGIAFLSVGRYDVTCLAAASGHVLSGRITDPLREKDLYDSARQLAEKVLPALSLHDGVFHLEAFLREDGSLLFSECAARLGGAGVPSAVRHKFGVDLYRAYVQTELGLPLDFDVDEATYEVGWAVLPVPTGRLTRVPERSALLAQPDVLGGTIRRPPGSEIPPTKPSSTFGLGTLQVSGPDPDALKVNLRRVLDWAWEHTSATAYRGDSPPTFLLWRESDGQPRA